MAISNASNQIVKVNLIPGIIPSVLHLSQYDTGAGRPITFSVYDGSQAFTIPSGVSIAFEGTKPDGNGFSFTCSKSGSSALLTNYTNQMTALPGKIMCQLVFTDTSGGRVGSLPVLMVVTPAGINGDTVISDSDIEAIVAAQNQYAVLNARLDAAIDQVNTTTNKAIDQVNTMTNEAIDQMNTTTNKAIDQMNTKANDLQNQYAVTNAKLDTAISAATQDSEVQDIRVKTNGVVAATAGNAVREQITELKNETNTGFKTIDADWAVGTISNGAYSPSHYRRVATKTAVKLRKGDIIVCDDSYRVSVYETTDWTTYAVVQTDGDYLIQIRAEPEASTNITDIQPFINAVLINTKAQYEIDTLKINKADYSSYGNLIDKDNLFANSLVSHGTGAVVAGNHYVTDFIPVCSGEMLQCRNIDAWYSAFYNDSKEYVSDITLSNNTYTVPYDGYVRFTITPAKVDSAIVTHWMNWSDNSAHEKTVSDIALQKSAKYNGTVQCDLVCGTYNSKGLLQLYLSPSVRIAPKQPIYISEGKVSISISSPYQISAVAFKNNTVLFTTPWTDGELSVFANNCDYIAFAIRKYQNGSEQTMTEYEDFGLVVTVENGIKTYPLFSGVNEALHSANVKVHENESYLYGIGTTSKIMSHLFIDGVYDGSNPIIPSQSIHDIEALARLGIHFAEGNVHRTSDGYYVVSHGNRGKLGPAFETNDGQPAGDVTFAGQTLEQLKTLYRFRSTHAKYRTRILTLEEWLYACIRNNIIPLIQPSAITISKEFIDIVKKITGNKVVINYEGNTNIRDYFDGIVMNYSSQTNIDQINTVLQTVGAPFIWCIESIAMAGLTESQLKSIVDVVHSHGCLALIPAFYLTVPQRILAMRYGFDVLGSGWDVEDFHDGNIDHLIGDVTFDDFSHEGTVLNETLVLESGKYVSNVNYDSVHIGKGSLHIKFSGTIHFEMGRYINTDLTSDGTEDIWLSTVFLDERPIFNILTKSAVTIFNILFDSSKC